MVVRPTRKILLSAALLLGAAMPLQAEVVLSLPRIETTAGTRLTVPLTLSGEAVPGILSLSIRISYDHSWLKLIEVQPGALTDAAGFMAQSNVLAGDNPFESLLAISLAGTELLGGPGEVANLVFEVASSAPSGAGTTLRFADGVTANRGRPVLSTQPGAIEIKILPEILARPGDIDGNRTVNLDDFFVFADRFGSRRGEAQFAAQCDLNRSGKIDYEDFFILADLFGKKY